MEITPEILILVVALLIIAAVAWLELRYIKNRRAAQAETAMEQDDAFNALATTKAVAESLRAQGRDTAEAEIILYQAEGAYQRRQFLDVLELAGRAKSSLRTAPLKELLACPVPEPALPEEEGEVSPPEETVEKASPEVPSTVVKKLPINYLESKFVIETARCLLDEAPEERKAAGALSLTDARGCFETADYTDALRHALKAKRILEGAEPVPEVMMSEAALPSAASEVCPHCGSEMNTDDQFCFSCGGRRTNVCPSCSAEAADGDVFCRKCGTKV